MSVKDCDDQISQGMRGILARWNDLSGIWNDAVRVEFERDYLAPLDATVAEVRRALQDLNRAMDRVRTVVSK